MLVTFRSAALLHYVQMVGETAELLDTQQMPVSLHMNQSHPALQLVSKTTYKPF